MGMKSAVTSTRSRTRWGSGWARAVAVAAVLSVTFASSSSAAVLGSEPPDFPGLGGPTFTADRRVGHAHRHTRPDGAGRRHHRQLQRRDPIRQAARQHQLYGTYPGQQRRRLRSQRYGRVEPGVRASGVGLHLDVLHRRQFRSWCPAVDGHDQHAEHDAAAADFQSDVEPSTTTTAPESSTTRRRRPRLLRRSSSRCPTRRRRCRRRRTRRSSVSR